MKYWEQFKDKSGFDSGTATPPEVEHCRFIYINILNELAERYNSSVRAVPFNACSIHNTYRIEFINVEKYNLLPDVKKTNIFWALNSSSFPNENYESEDEIMETCIRKANWMLLDDYIEISINIDTHNLDNVKKEIENGIYDNSEFIC
jgi:hypothetical protein